MNVEKKVIKNLNKCYALARLQYQGKDHFIVAAEKQDPAYLFDMDGNLDIGGAASKEPPEQTQKAAAADAK